MRKINVMLMCSYVKKPYVPHEVSGYKKFTQKMHEDKTFENIDYTEKILTNQEFVDCIFQNCNFSKTDLNNATFMDCIFTDCNFSMANVENLKLKTAKFVHCKLMGLDFSACNDFLFAVHFDNCTLDYASFFQKKIKNTLFLACSMKEVDFTETDLSMAVFKNCNLANAIFERSILEKADFRTAKNYSFDPALNKMKKAKFSYAGIAGLLTKFNIDIE